MQHPERSKVAIIGGGPAGLMAAEVLSREADFEVTIYDAMPSLGRKFLMAGRGGLNLTHTEPHDAFVARYGGRARELAPFIEAWSPDDVRSWCEGLGQETFVGTSGRLFPKIMKASGLLRAWLRRLGEQGVNVKTRHRWQGWHADGRLMFATPDGAQTIDAAATVLALGGASWPRLGSDSAWMGVLEQCGVAVRPLLAANAGFRVAWSDVFRARFEGAPLKSIAVTHGGHTARGEAIITSGGIEGGAIYAISSSLREAVLGDGTAILTIDLKPDLDATALAALLQKPRAKQSMTNFLRKSARLSPVAIGLLQEIALATGTPLGQLTPDALASAIKMLKLTVTGIAPIERAISSAGGVGFDAVDADLMLRQRPGVFVAGEMIDWEAPTGGYLLQACLATGMAAGHGARKWLAVHPEQSPHPPAAQA